MTKNKKESFILYTEQKELFHELTDEQAGILIKKIFDYVETGVRPDFSGMCKMAFITIRQMLDRNAEKYEEKREKMSQNGKKGGRPRLNTTVSDETEIIPKPQNKTEKPFFSMFKKTTNSKLFNAKQEANPVSFADIVKNTLPEFHEKIQEYRRKKALEDAP